MNLTIQHYQAWLPEVCKTARQAGDVILDVYRSVDFEIEKKSDGSPVTLADKRADTLIRHALNKLTPNIPVVSEENVDSTPFSQRQNWSAFWLVDPLDGTKEFIERTDEFCVNIALIVNGKAVLGVVYGPVLEVMYAAHQGGQSMKWTGQDAGQVLSAKKPLSYPVKVAVSRRHGTKVKAFLAALDSSHAIHSNVEADNNTFTEVHQVHMGSALKSCLVAEGAVDVYPRFGPTSHWDTAASQIIVEIAGGRIINASHQPLSYQPTEDLLNPYFMVIGDLSFDWPDFPAPLKSKKPV